MQTSDIDEPNHILLQRLIDFPYRNILLVPHNAMKRIFSHIRYIDFKQKSSADLLVSAYYLKKNLSFCS